MSWRVQAAPEVASRCLETAAGHVGGGGGAEVDGARREALNPREQDNDTNRFATAAFASCDPDQDAIDPKSRKGGRVV